MGYGSGSDDDEEDSEAGNESGAPNNASDSESDMEEKIRRKKEAYAKRYRVTSDNADDGKQKSFILILIRLIYGFATLLNLFY